MAISFAHLTGGYSTTNGDTTASISPSANSQVLVAVAVSVVGGYQTVSGDSLSVSGCNLTWSEVSEVIWGVRRSLYIFRGTGASPTSGSLTITWTSVADQVFEQMKWSVDEATGVDVDTPIGAAFTNTTGSDVSLSATISETPDAGDMVYAAIGTEDNWDTSVNSELDTSLFELGDSTGARHFHVAYDSSPDSDPVPGFSWSTGCHAGMVAFIVNVGVAGPITISVSDHFRFSEFFGEPSPVAVQHFRLRFLIDATGDPASKSYQIEYRYKPSGGSFGDWRKTPVGE